MPIRRKSRYVAILLAMVCAILVLGCGLGGVAIRQGRITPPNVAVDLGSVRVVGISSISSECTRLLVPGCIGIDPANAPRIYTLWLLRQRQRGSWSQPHITQLLSLRMGHPPQ